jgi:rubrerythrin
MTEELIELIEASMYKEVASETMYREASKKTMEPAVRSLLLRLADEEKIHLTKLKELFNQDLRTIQYDPKTLENVKSSVYLTNSLDIEGASLQDTLAIAIKHEELSIRFYYLLSNTIDQTDVIQLSNYLGSQEHIHLKKLTNLYEDTFNKEN